MATPSDLLTQNYEVVKLKTGSEIVGMVRETSEGIDVTLPMICHLSVQQPINQTHNHTNRQHKQANNQTTKQSNKQTTKQSNK